MRRLWALALALVPIASARAEEVYIEGWRGGSPPGEHIAFRTYALASSHRTVFRFEEGGEITSRRLGHPKHGVALGAGVEIYGTSLHEEGFDIGWVSVDYWQLGERGLTVLGEPLQLRDRVLPSGEPVGSRITQHYVKIRDGFDIRHRFALADEVSLDFHGGPVAGVVLRAESIAARTLDGRVSDGNRLTAASLAFGARAGIDLRLPATFMVRVGVDADAVPVRDHAAFSLTRRPALRRWVDGRAFTAFRWNVVELEVGARSFRTHARGGRVARARATMHGVDVQLAVRF